jgi:hypothetical protein
MEAGRRVGMDVAVSELRDGGRWAAGGCRDLLLRGVGVLKADLLGVSERWAGTVGERME